MAEEFGKTNVSGTAPNDGCRSSSAVSEPNLADHVRDGIAAAKLVFPNLNTPTPRITPMPGISEALLPCPFCAGKANVERTGTAKQSCIIACEDCGCRLETGEVFSIGECWNTRAPVTAALSGQAVGPDDDWEERGAADELRKSAIEECAKIADARVLHETTIFDQSAADEALSDSGRQSIQDRALARASVSTIIAKEIRALIPALPHPVQQNSGRGE